MLAVLSPFVNYLLHIIRQRAFKMDSFFSAGMNKAQLFGMQRLPVAECKAIIYKLFVFGKDGTFYNFVAPIKIIVE